MVMTRKTQPAFGIPSSWALWETQWRLAAVWGACSDICSLFWKSWTYGILRACSSVCSLFWGSRILHIWHMKSLLRPFILRIFHIWLFRNHCIWSSLSLRFFENLKYLRLCLEFNWGFCIYSTKIYVCVHLTSDAILTWASWVLSWLW